MKHAIDTQTSDTYDLDTHRRLTEAAVQWCEQYAHNWAKQQSGEREPEPPTPSNATEADADEALPADDAPHTEVVAVSSPVGDKESNATKPPASPDDEGTIDRILGATPSSDGGPVFHISWEGFAHLTDWKQELPEEVAKGSLGGLEWCTDSFIQLHDGEQKKLCLAEAFDQESGTHSLRLGNGSVAKIELHSCALQAPAAGKVAWTLEPKPEKVPALHHDGDIDWKTAPHLASIREGWGDGEAFPSFEEARDVILAVQSQGIHTMEQEADACEPLARLCVWLNNCNKQDMMLAKFDAEKLSKSWLQGSLVRDATEVLTSMDESDSARVRKEIRKRPTTMADLCTK